MVSPRMLRLLGALLPLSALAAAMIGCGQGREALTPSPGHPAPAAGPATPDLQSALRPEEELQRLLALGLTSRWVGSVLDHAPRSSPPSELSGTALSRPGPADAGDDPSPSPVHPATVDLVANVDGPLLAFSSDDREIWMLDAGGLHRFQPLRRALKQVPLVLPGGMGAPTWLHQAGSQLLLGWQTPGSLRPGKGSPHGSSLEQLLRFEPETGMLQSISLPGPLGPTATQEGVLWTCLGAPTPAVVQAVHGLGYLQPIHLPLELRATDGSPGAPATTCQHLAVGHSRLVLATASGALWMLDTERETWSPVALEGSDGLGQVLDMARSATGFVVSSSRRGLLELRTDGALTVLEGSARYAVLAVDGPHVWGVQDGVLERYNGLLRARVAYRASMRIVEPRRLMLAGRTVWIGTAEGLFRLAPDGLELERVVSARPPSPGRPASDAELDAVLSQIALTPPIQRRAVYETLLSRRPQGYDEVFLMGLNEDDPATLEVVVEYFRAHHPERAIPPLMDILLTLQGDRAMRDHLTGVLESFGPPVVPEVLTRLTEESPDALSEGARGALEQILVGATSRGGVEALNLFLEQARSSWLMAFGNAEGERPVPPAINDETFRILARRLEAAPLSLGDGPLAAVTRLARRSELPASVSALVPAILRHLEGPHQQAALYALTLVSDERAAPACLEIMQRTPRARFWALLALTTTGSPLLRQALVAGLADDQPEVRAASAYLVRSELVGEAAPRLRLMLLDESDGLCLSCAEALGTLRDERARPVLLARLARARREDQASLLLALAGLADRDLAEQLQGWISLEILSPAAVRRVSLQPGPSRQVLDLSAGILAGYGGPPQRSFLEQLIQTLEPEVTAGVREALLLADALPAGLDQVLRRAIVGRRLPGIWPGIPFVRPGSRLLQAPHLADLPTATREALDRIGPDSFQALRPLLFALIPPKADRRVREALEEILRYAPSPTDRLAAARALFVLADPGSVPALRRALQDPAFQPGPFPTYRHPVRYAAARALERLGHLPRRRADRTYAEDG